MAPVLFAYGPPGSGGETRLREYTFLLYAMPENKEILTFRSIVLAPELASKTQAPLETKLQLPTTWSSSTWADGLNRSQLNLLAFATIQGHILSLILGWYLLVVGIL